MTGTSERETLDEQKRADQPAEGPSGRSDMSSRRAPRHARTVFALSLIVAAMGGLAYAAVPLYQIFCQVTGYGGTTKRATAGADKILDKTIVIRFDSNVAKGLGWDFKPVQRKMTVRIGETNLAFFRATNTTKHAITGTASFNVAPEIAGSYFNKIACFCFTEQTLKPGQTVDMPVSFFVDPEFVKDADTAGVREITLSYTFYPSDEEGTGS